MSTGINPPAILNLLEFYQTAKGLFGLEGETLLPNILRLLVGNSLDAIEASGVLPEIHVHLERLSPAEVTQLQSKDVESPLLTKPKGDEKEDDNEQDSVNGPPSATSSKSGRGMAQHKRANSSESVSQTCSKSAKKKGDTTPGGVDIGKKRKRYVSDSDIEEGSDDSMDNDTTGYNKRQLITPRTSKAKRRRIDATTNKEGSPFLQTDEIQPSFGQNGMFPKEEVDMLPPSTSPLTATGLRSPSLTYYRIVVRDNCGGMTRGELSHLNTNIVRQGDLRVRQSRDPWRAIAQPCILSTPHLADLRDGEPIDPSPSSSSSLSSSSTSSSFATSIPHPIDNPTPSYSISHFSPSTGMTLALRMAMLAASYHSEIPSEIVSLSCAHSSVLTTAKLLVTSSNNPPSNMPPITGLTTPSLRKRAKTPRTSTPSITTTTTNNNNNKDASSNNFNPSLSASMLINEDIPSMIPGMLTSVVPPNALSTPCSSPSSISLLPSTDDSSVFGFGVPIPGNAVTVTVPISSLHTHYTIVTMVARLLRDFATINPHACIRLTYIDNNIYSQAQSETQAHTQTQTPSRQTLAKKTAVQRSNKKVKPRELEAGERQIGNDVCDESKGTSDSSHGRSCRIHSIVFPRRALAMMPTPKESCPHPGSVTPGMLAWMAMSTDLFKLKTFLHHELQGLSSGVVDTLLAPFASSFNADTLVKTLTPVHLRALAHELRILANNPHPSLASSHLATSSRITSGSTTPSTRTTSANDPTLAHRDTPSRRGSALPPSSPAPSSIQTPSTHLPPTIATSSLVTINKPDPSHLSPLSSYNLRLGLLHTLAPLYVATASTSAPAISIRGHAVHVDVAVAIGGLNPKGFTILRSFNRSPIFSIYLPQPVPSSVSSSSVSASQASPTSLSSPPATAPPQSSPATTKISHKTSRFVSPSRVIDDIHPSDHKSPTNLLTSTRTPSRRTGSTSLSPKVCSSSREDDDLDPTSLALSKTLRSYITKSTPHTASTSIPSSSSSSVKPSISSSLFNGIPVTIAVSTVSTYAGELEGFAIVQDDIHSSATTKVSSEEENANDYENESEHDGEDYKITFDSDIPQFVSMDSTGNAVLVSGQNGGGGGGGKNSNVGGDDAAMVADVTTSLSFHLVPPVKRSNGVWLTGTLHDDDDNTLSTQLVALLRDCLTKAKMYIETHNITEANYNEIYNNHQHQMHINSLRRPKSQADTTTTSPCRDIESTLPNENPKAIFGIAYRGAALDRSTKPPPLFNVDTKISFPF